MAKKPIKRSKGSRKGALVFFTTFAHSKDAENFAQTVVSKRLAACVTIVKGTKSFYQWDNKLQKSNEVLAIGKTTVNGFRKIVKDLKALHPYEVPELIAIKIVKGSPAYLNWIFRQSL